MYIQRNNVVRSSNHCSYGNTIMNSACVVELHVTVNYKEVLLTAQR